MNEQPFNESVNRIIAELTNSEDLSPDVLETILKTYGPQLADVAAYVRFSDDQYSRNFIYHCDRFQIILLCWKPGQASPVHDHGESACGVRVLAGEATESVFADGIDERATPSTVHALRVGAVSANTGKFVHRIANNSRQNLITLHVYSPPLVSVPRV